MRYQRAELPLKLDGLAAARTFFSDCLAEADQRRETLWVAHVDGHSRCLHLAAYQGEETGGEFPLREIVIDVAENGSEGLVLAHNHPSGDARPSDSDKRATRRLAMAADALDCAVLDHLILAGGQCVSLRQMGLL